MVFFLEFVEYVSVVDGVVGGLWGVELFVVLVEYLVEAVDLFDKFWSVCG